MSTPKPVDWWERFFKVGMIAKGIDGVLELVGGILLLVATPAKIQGWVAVLTQHELNEDPNDFMATHLLHGTSGLTGGTVFFGAIYLLLHGLVKIVLVIALLLNKLWAYPWMIAVLIAFTAYQAYQFALSPTVGLIVLTILDVLILVLTWHEYLHQRHKAAIPKTSSEQGPPSAGNDQEPGTSRVFKRPLLPPEDAGNT